MPHVAKLSVVLPVRDAQTRIGQRVKRVAAELAEIADPPAEIIVVDDGSRDATAEALEELSLRFPELRVARHSRPRGMEAAGQTGLERATGELVLIQETDSEFRVEDLRHLVRMSQDESIVAARAESAPRAPSGQLVRRLRSWGTDADQQLATRADAANRSGLQLIRRPHLQRLAAPGGDRYRLEAESYVTTSHVGA